MLRHGIADLGSNTARLIVYTYEPGKWFRITDGIRETVRLGEGLGRNGELRPEAVARARAAIELFIDYARATDLDDLEVLGTSALRDAANRDSILSQLGTAGHPMRVIDGETEAALGVLAVANGFGFPDAWVLDVGGGSGQLSRMRDRHYAGGRAYPIGSVRLSEAFLRSDPPKKKEVGRLEQFVAEELREVCAEWDGSLPLVGIGGTVRNLARMAQRRNRYPLAMLHGYRLMATDLEEITDELLRKPLAKRARISGLNPERADVIVAGALVFRWLLRRTGIESIRISGHGVREGAFYRTFLPAPHLLDDVRSFSVANRARQHPQPVGHIQQVRKLAGQLFDGLLPLHGLTAMDRDLLDHAAVLHDAGTDLDYYKHHRHGEYILTSSPLNGFSHRDLVLLAMLVRYHRKGNPRFGSYSRLMEKGDLKRLRQLSACLRLAESLERSRAGRVTAVRTRTASRRVILELVSSEEPVVELWEARKHAPLFRTAFGRGLELVAVGPD